MWIPDAVLEHLRAVGDEPDLSGTKYRLLRPLGRGGMGKVYAAEDTELEREVAVKVSAGGELRREAVVLARLEHPGIVPVHDIRQLPDGRVCYVMKLVRGERLDAWTRAGRDRRAVLSLFQRICEAVAFAHSNGVLHGDLKPENVMVGAFGEALVMDWGAARDLAEVEAAREVVGTRGYMSPEQASGGSTDARSDIYALGAILTFLVGERPPAALASICAKATAASPGDRYATVVDLTEDVRSFLDAAPVLAHRETVLERTARFTRRHAVILSLLAAYLVLRVLIGVVAR
jgi:eukaryotic-like serine/threonine-protein kinase